MLSQEVFKQGLQELENVFDGFSLTESKIKTWYKYSKSTSDSMWQKKIASCITGCRKVPTLADILDIRGYYSDHSRNYKDFESEEEFGKSKMPEWFKKKFLNKQVLKNVSATNTKH